MSVAVFGGVADSKIRKFQEKTNTSGSSSPLRLYIAFSPVSPSMILVSSSSPRAWFFNHCRSFPLAWKHIHQIRISKPNMPGRDDFVLMEVFKDDRGAQSSPIPTTSTHTQQTKKRLRQHWKGYIESVAPFLVMLQGENLKGRAPSLPVLPSSFPQRKEIFREKMSNKEETRCASPHSL